MKSLTEEQVADTLAMCLVKRPRYRSPDEDAVRNLTETINSYTRSPWTAERIAALKAERQAIRKEGQTCLDAGTILARDLAAWRVEAADAEEGSILKLFAHQRITALESAINLLRESRGALDHPGLTVKISNHGTAPEPWAYTAAGIADGLIRCLRDRGDARAGIGGPDGPVVKFVAICLRLAMSPEEPPKRSTIQEAIKNHLGGSLAYRRRGGY
jgi:hypothetical protein